MTFFAKFFLLTVVCALFSIHAFAQLKNNISLVYAPASTDVYIHNAIGDFGYQGKNGKEFGLIYTHAFTKVFSLETGLLYTNANTELHYLVPTQNGVTLVIRGNKVELLSVPVIAKITFLKYLFANGGLSLDHQTNYKAASVVTDQSGIGAEFGLGGQYWFRHLLLTVNPFVKLHALTSSANRNLTETGLRLGLGYSF